MIKSLSQTTYVLERYPARCGECPAFRQVQYSRRNERGAGAKCLLGYMSGHDTRYWDGNTRFSGCRIQENPNVTVDPTRFEQPKTCVSLDCPFIDICKDYNLRVPRTAPCPSAQRIAEAAKRYQEQTEERSYQAGLRALGIQNGR